MEVGDKKEKKAIHIDSHILCPLNRYLIESEPWTWRELFLKWHLPY